MLLFKRNIIHMYVTVLVFPTMHLVILQRHFEMRRTPTLPMHLSHFHKTSLIEFFFLFWKYGWPIGRLIIRKNSQTELENTIWRNCKRSGDNSGQFHSSPVGGGGRIRMAGLQPSTYKYNLTNKPCKTSKGIVNFKTAIHFIYRLRW